MIRFEREQRRLLAQTVCNVANIAAGALVFGQFVSGPSVSIVTAMVGACFWIVCVASAIASAKGGEP